MSVEHDEQEFQRYLEYQRERRQPRVETLGGVATQIVLSTIDLGVSEVADPATEARTAETDTSHEAEIIDLRSRREHRLAGFAFENAERGYGQAA
jgi:hypothetical protein